MVRVFRLFELPNTLVPNALYLIADRFDDTILRQVWTGIDGEPREIVGGGGGGSDGASAYEVAVANGFVGTEVEWLASLVGEPGANGTDGADGTNGTDGLDGADGPSAYDVAVANGFVGTEVEWLASLVGAPGADGVDGTDGIDGTDGLDGADGQGVPVGGTTGQVLAKASGTDFDTEWVTPSGGGGSLTSTAAALSSDVQMPTSGTWYDGPSVSLAAGTWLVTGTISFRRSATTATTWVARITDGTNHFASTQTYTASVSGITVSVSMSAIITLTGTTTILLQGTTNAGATACLMTAATPLYGSGNNATAISAVKIA